MWQDLLEDLQHYLMKEYRVRKFFQCLLQMKEVCVRKFEGIVRSKILWILQTETSRGTPVSFAKEKQEATALENDSNQWGYF